MIAEPDSPASQAIRDAARGIVATTPVELPVMQTPSAPAAAPAGNGDVSGKPLPMAQ